MKRSFLTRVLTWSLMALIGCVMPFEADFKEQPQGLIVQGYISNATGPYFIRLNRPAEYAFRGFNDIVKNATVYLTDDAGGRYAFEEIPGGRGDYRSVNFKGAIGRSYQLHIEIGDKRYASSVEQIRPVSAIERVYEEPFRTFDASNRSVQGGWNVYIDTQDPAETENYYRWNWIHYNFVFQCGIGRDRNQNPQYYIPCCTNCWNIVRCTGTDCINLATDRLVNGKKIARQKVAVVPIGCRDKYYIEIEQQSLSREAYAYWSGLQRLINNTGGVFDTAPTALPGNIRCLTDPTENVFGFFAAVGVSRVGHFVDRTQGERSNCPPFLPGREPSPPCIECKNDLFQTSQRPEFWEF
jgi:hypothetical protein